MPRASALIRAHSVTSQRAQQRPDDNTLATRADSSGLREPSTDIDITMTTAIASGTDSWIGSSLSGPWK
jgi:hypothetical protein